MEGTEALILQQAKKFDKNPKEAKIDELCKQIENLHLMMMKKPRKALKQAQLLC